MRGVCLAGVLGLVCLGSAQAACEFDVEVGDSMQFSMPEMAVDASCENVTVNLNHTGSLPAAAMGHNWVLSGSDDLQPVAIDGQSAGLENNWIKPEDDRVLASTAIIGGGEQTSVTFTLDAMEAGGDYMFFCSAPGHWAVMQGKFVIV